MSVSPQIFENLERRARAAEDLIESLEKEIKELAVTKILSDLRAENESLKEEVASMVRQLTIMEKIRKGHKIPTNLEEYRLQRRISASKSVTRNVEVVPAERDIPVPKDADVKTKAVEKHSPDKQKRKEEKKNSGGKTKGEKAQKGDVEEQPVDVGKLDFRVGKIVNVKKHPDADSLYVEEIDLGEERPRTIVSGLVKHVPLEEMQNRMVIVLCNLKPAKMRGVTSEGMVMCASTPEKVEVLVPPEKCVPGDKVVVEGFTSNPEAVLNPKKKIFETVAVDLKTNGDKIATYKGVPLSVAGKGVIAAPTLINVFIK